MSQIRRSTVGGNARLRYIVIGVIASATLLFAFASPAAATASTLYVDNGNQSCSDSGPGTSATPFCTIGRGASVAAAGQTVQVASGTYPELVTVGHSGSVGAPIVLAAAPGASVTVSGQANGFKISGRSYVTIQGFTVSSTTSYGIYVTTSTNIILSGNTVTQTGSHGFYVAGSSANVTVSGNTVSSTTGYGVYLNTLSNISVNGSTIAGTTNVGIYAYGCSNITVSGNDVSYSGQPVQSYTKYGIKLASTTSSLVSGNTAHNNSDAGVFLDAATSGVEVTGNRTYGNARGYSRAAPGIDIRGYGNTIDRNISYNNEDSGLQFYPGSHDNVVVDNLTYGNGDHGIDNNGSTGQQIISNTVYGNVTAGINAEGNSSGATIANNISVDNGIHSPRTHGDIRVDSTSTAGTTVDYNMAFLTIPDTFYVWGSSSYTTLAAFQAATGQEPHGIQADPHWVSPGSGNFQLQPGSPAIDSANSGVSGATATDLDGNVRVDDPATVNSGAGPRSYDDRGAYEFQP
jgi:parallel beta-helix repeat protein